jgi:hypothetical protein
MPLLSDDDLNAKVDAAVNDKIKLNFKWFTRRVRRVRRALACKTSLRLKLSYDCAVGEVIPEPQALEKRVRKAIQLFASIQDAKTSMPLFTTKTWKVVKNLIGHIRLGCLSDRDDIDYYFCTHRTKDGACVALHNAGIAT